MPSFDALIQAYRRNWSDRRLRLRWALVVGSLSTALAVWSRFISWVETRHGVLLSDPLLRVLPTVDLTWPIFTMVYGGLLVGLVLLARTPRLLSIGILSYAVMLLLRIACMYLVPLDPPPGMIPLADPFLRVVGVVTVPTRDLFFSGHTATLSLLAFAAGNRPMRRTYLVLTALMGTMVLLQHVHWSIDVVVAPFAALASNRLARWLHGNREPA